MLPIRWLTLSLRAPAAQLDRVSEFWALTTGTTPSDPARDPEPTCDPGFGQVTLVPADGTPYLSIQGLEDGAELAKRIAERDGSCSLSLLLDPSGSLDDARDEAVALGAGTGSAAQGAVYLRSPGGYAFSIEVADKRGGTVPPPYRLGTGGLSRADQICLDIPPTQFDAECVFWQALTGWHLSSDPDSEFASLTRPADIPIRILLQRRDYAKAGDAVTGHLDFSSDDRATLAREHLRARASMVGEWPGWISLRDPAGRIYCLTARDPRGGLHP